MPLISTAEAKLHCRIFHDTDDDYVASLVTAATAEWVSLTNKPVTSATYTRYFETEPADGFLRVAYLPVDTDSATNKVTYDNDAGVVVNDTLLEAEWITSDGFTVVEVDEDWRYPLTLTYVAGTTTVPTDVRQAILFRIAEMYHYRGDDVRSPESKAFLAIVRRYRLEQIS